MGLRRHFLAVPVACHPSLPILCPRGSFIVFPAYSASLHLLDFSETGNGCFGWLVSGPDRAQRSGSGAALWTMGWESARSLSYSFLSQNQPGYRTPTTCDRLMSVTSWTPHSIHALVNWISLWIRNGRKTDPEAMVFFLSISDPATSHVAHEAMKNKTKELLQVQEFEWLYKGLGDHKSKLNMYEKD